MADPKTSINQAADMDQEARALQEVLTCLTTEIARQDRLHPAGYPAHRDGVRLGIAHAEDELEEVKLAHRDDRCKCPIPNCGHARWLETETEVLQTAAVLLRLARSIRAAENGR
jgi:hypothetical protein